MDYIPRIPAPPLNAYIDDLYYINGASPYPRLKIPPMPSLHLMINLGQPFQVYSPAQSQPFATCNESWWIGLWNTHYSVDWAGPVQFYGVHFKPSGIYPFLRLPLFELRNQVVPVDAVWGRDVSEIRERLAAAPSVHDGLARLERLLLARLAEDLHGLDVVQHAIGQIDRQHGAVSIRGLSDHIGISENHLGTQFKRIVGVTPKDLAHCSQVKHLREESRGISSDFDRRIEAWSIRIFPEAMQNGSDSCQRSPANGKLPAFFALTAVPEP